MIDHNISNAYTKTHNRISRRGPNEREAKLWSNQRKSRLAELTASAVAEGMSETGATAWAKRMMEAAKN